MFLTGSRAFFEGLDGFRPHDTDWMQFAVGQKHILTTIGKRVGTVFTWRDNRDDFLAYVLERGNRPTQIAALLIPQAVEHFGFGPKEWQAAKPLAEKLDTKHKYLGVILDAYLENGEARLTDAQRMAAFECYKQARNVTG